MPRHRVRRNARTYRRPSGRLQLAKRISKAKRALRRLLKGLG